MALKQGELSDLSYDPIFRLFFILKLCGACKLWFSANPATFSHEEVQRESTVLRGKDTIKCLEPTRRRLGCVYRASSQLISLPSSRGSASVKYSRKSY